MGAFDDHELLKIWQDTVILERAHAWSMLLDYCLVYIHTTCTKDICDVMQVMPIVITPPAHAQQRL